jgi:hypothetical protein
MNKKILTTIISCFIIFTMLYSTAGAATGYEGYAVYRDGVTLGNWHAALMDEPYSTYYLPVVQAPGGSECVKWDSWVNFMNSKNFKGVYKPISSTRRDGIEYRDLFVSMGRNLISEGITYTVFEQMQYNVGSSGYYVDPNEIISMRCDGVVEYIYEWYGFRVFGSDACWDITLSSNATKIEHSGMAVTPEIQSRCLSLVTSNIPSN